LAYEGKDAELYPLTQALVSMKLPTDHQPTEDTLRQTSQLFDRDFALTPTGDPPTFVDLQEKIALVITQLLQREPERLFQLMYRLDVDEQKFRQLLERAPNATVVTELSVLVLEREMLRVYWRNRYRE